MTHNLSKTTDITTGARGFDGIGPFKGVAENDRAYAARVANDAADAAYAEAVRQSKSVGDKISTVLHPSLAYVNNGWNYIERQNKFSLVEARELKIVPFIVWCVFAIVIICCSLTKVSEGNVEALPVGIAFAAFLGLFTYFIYRLSSHVILGGAPADIRRKGFHGDILSTVMSNLAGNCLLIGEKALHVGGGTALDNEYVTNARSVYYDALGEVTVSVVEGLERVTAFSRVGDEVFDFTPDAQQGGLSAHALAALIRERAALAPA